MEPSSVGPYRIIERLGAGGMGEVYLAVDTRLNRKVALKSLTDPSLDAPHARSRLLREARAAAQITHPNIAAIYDILDTEAHPCIVMEYAQGETLARIASRGPLPCHQVLTIASQLAGALAHAHAAGVVHRDLKPSNVVLTPDGAAKVLDFGLARVSDLEQDLASADASTCEVTLSRAGVMAGTPAYMAPEQLGGHPASPSSDIYSLGATLFELLTGRKPFDAPTTRDVIYQVLAKPTPLVSAVNGSVPPVVDAIVAKAMAKDPAERYRSAAEMADDLQQAALKCAATPDRSGSRGSTVGLAASLAAITSRRRWTAGLAGAALVAAVLVPAGFLLQERMFPVPPVASQFVAVLPFANQTGDPAQDAVAAGFSEAIVSALEGLSAVNVLSRPADPAISPNSGDARKAAREHGVTMLVSGSLRRVSGVPRFVVAVEDPSGKVVSEKTYHGWTTGTSGTQAQATSDIVAALNVSLTAADRGRLSRTPACQAASYADYAAGRLLLDRRDVAGNVARAEKAFRSAVARDPSCAPAMAGLADACLAQYGETRDPSWIEQARSLIVNASAADPDSPAIRISLARFYLSTGKNEQAENAIRQVIEKRPFDDEPHRVLSDALDTEGRKQEADAEIQQAIRLRPNNVLNHLVQGAMLLEAQRYKDAVDTFGRVLAIQPDNAWALTNRCSAHAYLGAYEQALACYQALPSDATNLTNIGVIYFALGRFREAATVCAKAVELDPGNDIKRRNLADAYAAIGDRTSALREFEQAATLTQGMIRVNAHQPRVLARHAFYDAKLGRREEALRHASQAVELARDDPYVLYRRAVVHCLLGQPVDAVIWLERALQKDYPVRDARGDADLDPIKTLPKVAEMLRGDR
ncbi:MAG: protein kinase [Acidobacteria bacterium]|nr:protein kinase [Acidobacteriota bacterium]